jgi:hypothetical protein
LSGNYLRQKKGQCRNPGIGLHWPTPLL